MEMAAGSSLSDCANLESFTLAYEPDRSPAYEVPLTRPECPLSLVEGTE